ncbi:MAG TPA: hypothetical protein VM141_07220 [Planctomycetota bacterium]|nr:hypothetical protein [Planctomycetota bacterium]
MNKYIKENGPNSKGKNGGRQRGIGAASTGRKIYQRVLLDGDIFIMYNLVSSKPSENDPVSGVL